MPRGGRFILETSLLELDDAFIQQHRPINPGHYVVLAVSDNGVGMDQATASRIFEPFFTTKEVGKGTGLGLATVYGIVQQNAGLVWVYSEPNRGTTFKIYLPSAEEKLGERTESMAEAPVRRREGTTIVLVEDDEIMLSLTRQLLLENGYTVLEAKDGNAALEIVRSHRGPIHLLLTDVVMRGMSGPELVSKVRSSHPEVKPVFMSGYTGELIAQDQPASQSVPLLEKPFTRAALYNILDAALG
jgi:CheY-like chemotaxis protein